MIVVIRNTIQIHAPGAACGVSVFDPKCVVHCCGVTIFSCRNDSECQKIVQTGQVRLCSYSLQVIEFNVTIHSLDGQQCLFMTVIASSHESNEIWNVLSPVCLWLPHGNELTLSRKTCSRKEVADLMLWIDCLTGRNSPCPIVVSWLTVKRNDRRRRVNLHLCLCCREIQCCHFLE